MRYSGKLRQYTFFFLLVMIISVVVLCSPWTSTYAKATIPPFILFADNEYKSLGHEGLLSWIESLTTEAQSNTIDIIEPLPNTILPGDMASPLFLWEDPIQSDSWLLTMSQNKKIRLKAMLSKPWWSPEQSIWEELKAAAAYKTIEVTIQGISGWDGRQILSENTLNIKISKENVDGRIMFIQKPLPFSNAKKYPELTNIIAGDISSYEMPDKIMSGVKTCSNCHTYSSDGKTFALDIDYGGDKGGFAIAQLQPKMKLGSDHIYSWNTVPVREPAVFSMGLFGQLSPDGNHIAATVNERAVFIPLDDLYFSQLFFPIAGQIAIFNQKTKQFRLLEGASHASMVYTSPAWSPDGKTIAFSSIPTDHKRMDVILNQNGLNKNPAQNISDLNKQYPVHFDIYTLPFNNGDGGSARPLPGASQNGYSNFFPRYSPDEKWIVFTQSPTGLLLQPNSKLMILPSKGGKARSLDSNQPVMNSWHSWSPNSKWLVFSSKAKSAYTELYLTHIDDKGNASPAIRLFRFSRNDLAALIPEFIPNHLDIPATIEFEPVRTDKVILMDADGR